jgi:hypothetical protein
MVHCTQAVLELEVFVVPTKCRKAPQYIQRSTQSAASTFRFHKSTLHTSHFRRISEVKAVRIATTVRKRASDLTSSTKQWMQSQRR